MEMSRRELPGSGSNGGRSLLFFCDADMNCEAGATLLLFPD